MTTGLLIVNADDWGLDAHSTDAISTCVELGAVSSMSGMVFMIDSTRAAQIAEAERLPVGLHLNFVEPFTDPAAPIEVLERQARLAAYFSGPRVRRWFPSPAQYREIGSCIQDQWAEFVRLYGREPTHVDGHQHVHQAWPIIMSSSLQSGIRMRPSFTFRPRDKSSINRMARTALNRFIRRRFATPDYFFSIRDLHPDLGGSGLEDVLRKSAREAVEIMTHPAWDDEAAVLKSQLWMESVGQCRVGSYEDLG